MTNQEQELPDLTERQRELLDTLPATIGEISEALGIKKTTSHGHINRTRQKGVGLRYDEDGGVWYIADDRAPALRRVSTEAKQSRTRKANELIEAEESVLLRRLRATDPLEPDAPDGDGDAEAFVAAFGDTHFGDVVESERGDVLYDMDAASASVEDFARKCRKLRGLEGEYTDFDECHLLLLGDIATGTHIYDGQIHDIEAYLAEQVSAASQALVDLVLTLSEEFDSVAVHAVLGNHGKDRAAAARGSNTDLICYRWMQDALRRERPPGVEVEIAESSYSLTTEIKGQTVHLRHGQDTQTHVDKTARSEADWRGIWMKYKYDIAARGHYHNASMDWVCNAFPVLTVPSPKPGDEFAEKIGSPDVSDRRRLGWCFGVSEDRRMTFKRLVDAR
jgi:predicted phosphodiesterase